MINNRIGGYGLEKIAYSGRIYKGNYKMGLFHG